MARYLCLCLLAVTFGCSGGAPSTVIPDAATTDSTDLGGVADTGVADAPIDASLDRAPPADIVLGEDTRPDTATLDAVVSADAGVLDGATAEDRPGDAGAAPEDRATVDVPTDVPLDRGPSCDAGETLCGTTCVDTARSADHCGACGASCRTLPGVDSARVRCEAGMCVVADACLANRGDCNRSPADGCEADLSTTSTCGACGTRCSEPTPSCSASSGDGGLPSYRCESGCGGMTPTRCAGSCVDTETNTAHCGGCGSVCSAPGNATAACRAGACTFDCRSGFHRCGGSCLADTDPASCGTRCEPCVAPANSVASCESGSCGFRCVAGFHRCGMSCVSDTDPATCSTSCSPCAVPANGRATCDGRTCGTACNAGFHLCGAACVSNTSTTSCGTSCTPCTAPTNATATCEGTSCGFACNAGYYLSAGMCFPDLPRLLAPLSTSRVTSRRPRLRWTIEGGAASVTVRLCRDRAMMTGCTTFASSTFEGAPTSDLAPGVWFWQVERPLGMAIGISMTWQFVVGARTAARNTSWGTVPDFNGDGIGDLAVGTTYQAPLRVYYGRRTGFLDTPSFQTSSGQVPTASVASAGDVDGDGFADLVTGEGAYAPLALFYGAATGLSTSTGRLERLNSTVPGGFTGLGYSVSSAGDVNGDGYADIVAGEVYAGNALVFFGSAAGIRRSPTVIPGPSGGCGRFGWSVSGADVNGDGYSDVLVGDPCVPDSLLTPRFHVYLGSALGISTSPVLSVRGRSGAQFGWSVAEAGDLNGDGYTDIAVGAPGEVTPGPQLFVYQGGPAGVSATATVTLTRSDTNFFGAAIRGAGDVTGDGYPDLLIGNAFGGTRVHLYAGSASGVAAPPLASLTGDSSFGTGVTGLGDLNGDGFEDVAVGTPGVGREYVTVYLGASMGFGVTLPTIYGPRDGSEYGRALAVAGSTLLRLCQTASTSCRCWCRT